MARVRPSGRNATASGERVGRVSLFRPLARSHNWTPLEPPAARVRASGLKASDATSPSTRKLSWSRPVRTSHIFTESPPLVPTPAKPGWLDALRGIAALVVVFDDS
jgi:hypothetical protein